MTYRRSEKASVEEPCVKFARDHGVMVLKVNPLWAAGWQDRIFFVPGGKPLIIEFKRPGGPTSKLQAQRHKDLISAGYDHHVIDEKEEGIALIRSRLGPNSVHEKGDGVGSAAPHRRAVSRPRSAKD